MPSMELLGLDAHPKGSGKLVAAIPAFNEEKTIGSVVLGALRHVDQVVVVDDGSTDATGTIAEQAGAKVLRHLRNRGYGAALRTCFEYARESNAWALVVLDADGQHRPQQIPTVLGPVVEGRADLAIGSRFLSADATRAIPLYRRMGIRALTGLTNLGAPAADRVRDAQSGFRAFSRRAIEALDPQEADMGASTEILWDAQRRGLRIQEVSVNVDYGPGGSSQDPIRHGLGVLLTMIRYAETEHSLLLFSFPGLALFLGGLGLGGYVFEKYIQSSMLPVGLALATVLLLITGMLLGFTGLVLHAVINAHRRMR